MDASLIDGETYVIRDMERLARTDDVGDGVRRLGCTLAVERTARDRRVVRSRSRPAFIIPEFDRSASRSPPRHDSS